MQPSVGRFVVREAPARRLSRDAHASRSGFRAGAATLLFLVTAVIAVQGMPSGTVRAEVTAIGPVAPPAAPATSPPVSELGQRVPSATDHRATAAEFLTCVRRRESRGNYRALNPSGAAGAYQLMPETARATATHAGRPDLARLPVLAWSPADQDAMARALYDWQGPAPWGWVCVA